jgi:hypothetical protein
MLVGRVGDGQELSDEKKRAAALSELMGQLPKTNRLLVELILKFLSRSPRGKET